MRVLWVEDFGDATVGGLLDKNFSKLLPQSLLDNLVEIQNRKNIEVRPRTFDAWRSWYSNLDERYEVEIDIFRFSSDIQRTIDSGNLVDEYDVALLDVNLTSGEFFADEEIEKPDQGGFVIYSRLIRAGFPSGRIALLTAHSGEGAVKEFQDACRRYGHDPLECHPKEDQIAGRWIARLSAANNRFLAFRRGTLDGIRWSENALRTHGAQAIRFNDYVSDDADQLSFDQTLDYLEALRHAVPVRMSADQLDSKLRGFRILLACEWERADPEKWKSSEELDCSLCQLMKNFRNWSSHGLLRDQVGIDTTALATLIAFRASFRVPNDQEKSLRPFENFLISAMHCRLSSEDIHNRLASSYLNARKHLHENINERLRKKNKDGKNLLAKDQKTYRSVIHELSNLIHIPKGFSFPQAWREFFAHDVLFPHWRPQIDFSDPSTYRKGWEGHWDTLPPWVQAVWPRMFGSNN